MLRVKLLHQHTSIIRRTHVYALLQVFLFFTIKWLETHWARSSAGPTEVHTRCRNGSLGGREWSLHLVLPGGAVGWSHPTHAQLLLTFLTGKASMRGGAKPGGQVRHVSVHADGIKRSLPPTCFTWAFKSKMGDDRGMKTTDSFTGLEPRPTPSVLYNQRKKNQCTLTCFW